ncbi:carbohydrate ABC transporter permease [Subtercola sp. RTI3]|nr:MULTISPECIES: carbohydrate ABC transporter permease [Subtercola]MEA9986714.1 carbohydrate ABC transporter permease [Subtercola sp. RTI3]
MLPNIPAGITATIWLLIAIVPIYYVVITSLKNQTNFFSGNALLPPASPTLDNYALVLQNNFLAYFANSLIVTLVSVAFAVAFALMAAFAIVRGSLTSRRLRLSFSVFLLGLAIPLQAVIIPIYLMITRAGLYDSLIALILPSVAFSLPLSIIILVNFLRDIPNELYEAMRVDGASNWKMLTTMVLPLARPALTTVAIYDGLNVWNGFIFPLVLTQSPDKRVLPLALWSFQGEFTSNIPAVLAAVVLSTLPILALYIFGRRQLLAGLTAGFGK